MDEQLETILRKPGREWTPEERRLVQAAVKKQGRQTLKKARKELRDGE